MRQPADLPLHLLLAGLRVAGYRLSLNCGPNANRVYVPLQNEIPTVARIQGQIAGTTDRQNLVIIGGLNTTLQSRQNVLH